MKICYIDKKYSMANLDIIDMANTIIDEYKKQGYSLTLRQLYYQFVSRDIIPNNMQSYKRLGSIINDGRLSGDIDWEAIEDRTRNLKGLSHWNSPDEIIKSASECFRIDLWEDQPCRVEVWVEKEALAGVVERAAAARDVPFFCCRGYTSQSEMWSAAIRILKYIREGQTVHIIHLGDHDPSGIDMSRDIEERIRMFLRHDLGSSAGFEFKRIALNSDQIEEYSPPPNPAKLTDSRAKGYISRFGKESWELDALEPVVLNDLIDREISKHIDSNYWESRIREMEDYKKILAQVSSRWDEITDFLKENPE